MAEKKQSKKSYGVENIRILEGLEPIKLRPKMYVLTINDLFLEIFLNALDEVSSGYGNEINVSILKNGAYKIQDFGRGVPASMSPKYKMNTLDIVFTKMNAGAKFSDNNYSEANVQIGSHGIGVKATVALSEYCKVEVIRDGNIYNANYKNGGDDNELCKIVGKQGKKPTGTTVEFLPDKKYWPDDQNEISEQFIKDQCQSVCYLFPKLTINFKNEKTKEEIKYHSEKGIEQFIEDNLSSSVKRTSPNICIPRTKLGNGEEAEIVFCWTNKEKENISLFANLLKIIDGGTPIDGLETGIYETLQNFANQNHDAKIKDPKFDMEDATEGLLCCVSMFLSDKLKQFIGQTKTKLLTPQLKPDIRNLVIQNLTKWLKENKAEGLKIIKNIYASRDARKAAERAKITSRAVLKKAQKFISDKYSKPQKYDPEKSSLIVVEGDSAKSTVEKARTEYVGVYPIRGKLPNAETTNYKQLLQNEEVKTIISLINTNIGDKFDIRKLAFKEIIILADADP